MVGCGVVWYGSGWQCKGFMGEGKISPVKHIWNYKRNKVRSGGVRLGLGLLGVVRYGRVGKG